jgi:hypothetical protein
MKILFHIPTETLISYPRNDDEPVIGLDPEYDVFEIIQEDEPAFDPSTQWIEATQSIDKDLKIVNRGWIVNNFPSFKVWVNAQAFMAEFTMAEKSEIALSNDPTIAALRLDLSTWFSEMHSNSEPVVIGLDKLVELGIISQQRMSEIIEK